LSQLLAKKIKVESSSGLSSTAHNHKTTIQTTLATSSSKSSTALDEQPKKRRINTLSDLLTPIPKKNKISADNYDGADMNDTNDVNGGADAKNWGKRKSK
jgi:hypothetical protein